MIRIYNSLKDAGFTVYSPGKHEGLCTAPYVVVKEGSRTPELGTNVNAHQRIQILLYVPIANYFKLEQEAVKVRSALRNLLFLRKTGFEREALIDDDKKAYTTAIEYDLMRKMEV